MINFKQLSFRNFLSCGDQPTIIDLNKCLTTIIKGKNGGGKSTFEDALVYNLFGKPFRKVRLGQLINKVNEKGLVTELTFSIGSTEYRVVRGMKPTIFEIFVNETMLEQPAESKDYQDILENNILKLNYKTFTNIIILGSASFVPFMQLPLSSRREIIENILDISVFSEMNDILKVKIKEAEGEVNDLDTNMKVAKERYTLKLNFFHSMETDRENKIKDLNAKIESVKETKVNTEEKITLCKYDILEIKKEIDEFGDIDVQKTNKMNEKSKILLDINDIEHDIKVKDDNNKKYNLYKTKLDDNNKKIESLEYRLSQESVLVDEYKKNIDKFIGIDEKKREIENRVAFLKQDNLNIQKSIDLFTLNSKCPTCGYGLDGEYGEEVLNGSKTSLRHNNEELVILNNGLVVVIENQSEQLKYKTKLADKEQDIKSINNELIFCKKNKDDYSRELVDVVVCEPEDFDVLREKISTNKLELEVIVNDIKELNNKVGSLNVKKEVFVNENRRLSLLQQEITNIESLKVSYLVEIEKLNKKQDSDVTQEDIDNLATEIKAFDSEILKKKNLLHLYDITKKLLKDDGLKTNIIKQYLPIINATVNKYLDRMDFPINFEFDENFNEVIQSKYRQDFCYYSFSEGEKARIDLALLFAWRDISLKKSRNAANILIFDEIFDGSLDSDGIGNFMDILGVNTDGFSTFIISHKNDTINSNFDRTLEFGKNGHFSIMKETI